MQPSPTSNQYLTIITFHGKQHQIPYDRTMTTGELKQIILSIDDTVSDFDFLYGGKIIKSNQKILGQFINESIMKVYTNAKGVHGGC